MIPRTFLLLCAFLFMALIPAGAAEPSASGQTYALLVGGLGGQEPYTRWYEDWLGRFQKYLTGTAGVPAANVTVLSREAATKEAITGALGKLAQQIKPQDQFIFFVVGHGELKDGGATLILPGPDMSADDLAAALNGIASKHQVILNFSATSGDMLKHIVSADRVNIAATSPTETDEPVFAEFFLRGLESKRADTEKSGTITMLQAYNWAAQQTVLWITRWQQTGPPEGPDSATLPSIWKASGRETVEIFEKLYANVPSRKLDPASDRNAADAVMEIAPPNGEVTDEWKGRRVIDEHAFIEDSGQEIGVSVVSEKSFQPILGAKPGDPGYVAAHTILGKPAQ